MMKTKIKQLAPAVLAAMALASCSEDSWNNGLDGFEGNQDLSQKESVEYTLTAADYKEFSVNRFNKALARQDSIDGISPDAIKALKAVEANKYITPATPAARYMPNLLNDSIFPYFALTEGSAINLTYNEVADLPEVMKLVNGAESYTVSETDYQDVYGSDEDYATAFSPSHPATAALPRVLANYFDDASEGDCVVVQYNQSNVDPEFGAAPFEMSDVLKPGLADGMEVDVKGVVTATCKVGFILTDKAGSILVYSSGYTAGTYAVGTQLEVKATLGSYKNCLQIPYDNAVIVPASSQAYTYPSPVTLTPDYLVQAGANESPVLAVYGEMTGTINVSGNYINLAFDGRSDVRGSIYNVEDALKAELADGKKVKVYGYFTQTSKSGEIVNANMVVTRVESAAAGKRHGKRNRVVAVPFKTLYAVYTLDGGAWKAVPEAMCVQPSDYAEMGLTYGNFQGTQAEEYLPIMLARQYPFAQKDQEVYVAYRYYSNKQTVNACALWAYDGTKWYDKIKSNGVTEVTNQFVKRDGKWQLDPSITLTLPAGKGIPFSAEFYQACVDWVLNNVPDGAKYVTSYGNNDYYTGASAYQNNIDLRPGAARTQYAEAYKDMTDEEVVAVMKKRFEEEVGPAVVAARYPDLAPIGDFHPTVTIDFYIYDGATKPQTIVFEVEEKGKFKFVSCTWNE